MTVPRILWPVQQPFIIQVGKLLTGVLLQPVFSDCPGSCLQHEQAAQDSLTLLSKLDVMAQRLQTRLQGPGELAQRQVRVYQLS